MWPWFLPVWLFQLLKKQKSILQQLLWIRNGRARVNVSSRFSKITCITPRIVLFEVHVLYMSISILRCFKLILQIHTFECVYRSWGVHLLSDKKWYINPFLAPEEAARISSNDVIKRHCGSCRRHVLKRKKSVCNKKGDISAAALSISVSVVGVGPVGCFFKMVLFMWSLWFLGEIHWVRKNASD